MLFLRASRSKAQQHVQGLPFYWTFRWVTIAGNLERNDAKRNRDAVLIHG